MFLGIKFEDIPIKILVKYNVKPIGIKTTTPAIKQFLKVKDKDFFVLFLAIKLTVTCVNNKQYSNNKQNY